jgi:hypothetical protein
VEALEDLQKAIELNDNREIYRSKLLLDADLAARSASLARIYTDLGFQQRALVEGWKSVNTDPADFSGHRFLADTYSALPRHEVARVSELLISQLLQPINITPIQPHLAESNLFVISGGGPADLSFNEFNPLFNRNRVALQVDTIVGSHSTFGEEVVGSGIYDNASFSIGQYYFKTNGFRENADLKDQIYNAFLQYNLFPQTSIQGEFRYRNTKSGDLTLRFPEDDFAPNLQNTDERTSVRLGFHQEFTPGSDLIGNFMYQHQNFDTRNMPNNFYIFNGFKGNGDAFSGELQYLFRSKYVNLVGGAGYFNVDSDTQALLAINLGGLILHPSSINRNINHTDIYVYSYINPLKNLTFTAGLTGDFFQGGLTDKNECNPKFGVTWNPFDGTTLRGAVFKAFKRTLITNQTLEPTQVAGFNQFFDDPNETKTWNYGVGIDQKFLKSLYGGAEFFYRSLEFPVTELAGVVPVVSEEKWRESVARAYAYWTPYKWFGLTAEYLYEHYTRNETRGALGVSEVTTNRVPLGVNFFHPSGLSATLKASYVNQRGDFQRQNPVATGPFTHGADDFWLLDAAINYRLPKRYGFISFGVKNLFNRNFQFFDVDYFNPSIQPGRFIYGKITLSLP